MSNTPRSLSPPVPPSRRSPSYVNGSNSSRVGGGGASPQPSAPPPPPRGSSTSLTRTTAGVDPFLQQSQDIRLTERDRQEGYDVDLLNAKPRTGGTKQRQHVPATAAAAAAAAGTTGTAAGVPTAAGTSSAYPHGLGSRPYDGTTTSNPESNGTTANEKGALFQDGSQKRYQKPWYMRKLAILAIVLLIAAAALAIGLGVGLSERRHDKKDKSDSVSDSNSTSSGQASRDDESSATESRNATATLNTSRTRGTVIPSSLYSQYTDTASDSVSADWTSGLETAVPTMMSPSPTMSPSPAFSTDGLSNTFEGTTRATTGNLPIPADSATTVGTIVYSSISALGGLQRRTNLGIEPTGIRRLRRKQTSLN
ncbi:hypothetical protein OIO90_006566 [Microbotryomycetes sp. JL221]|nr:hypothetical protein OIO90_006566 [Microbotryomycetes sp. JL221]